MARVKPEEIIDDLSSEMRKALATAVSECLPDVAFDEQELFRAFKRAFRRECRTWERVTDGNVEA